MSNKKRTSTFSGNMLSPGMGEGNTYMYRDVLQRSDEYYDIDDDQVEEELHRLDRAIAKILEDLETLAGRVKKEIDSELSSVFHAHMAMVQDPSLRTEIEKEITDELVSTGRAVKTVFRRWERRFRSMEAKIARQKGDDIRDLAQRLISSLAGIDAHALENFPTGSVLVTSRLLPSDTIFLARRAASAAVLEFGGSGSHAALFAREIGLPCIAGITDLLKHVPSDSLALVDADAGTMTINPDHEHQDAFRKKYDRLKRTHSIAQERAQEPAVTKGGTVIPVLANVGGVDDTRAAIENGADGIGLYRIETGLSRASGTP